MESTRTGAPPALFHAASQLLDQGNFSEARSQFALTMRSATQREFELYRLNAVFSLGLLELYGFAPESKKGDGLQYLRELAELNVAEALRTVPEGLSSATALVAAAQYQLGKAYAEGMGVDIDLAQAEQYWLRASLDGSRSGSVEAQQSLGELYASPRRKHPTDPLDIIPPDFTAAKRWREAASRNGSVEATFALGQMLAVGLGGKPDREQAIVCLRSAAQRGHIGATSALALQYYNMRLGSLAFQTAEPLTELVGDDSLLRTCVIATAEREHRSLACFVCARCLELGSGVQADAARAQRLYARASTLDRRTAHALRARVESGEL